MKNLFKYHGTISSFSFKDNGYKANADIVLGDINDWDKAPTRIQAFGAPAKYIDDIEGTDAEERYIQSDWYYDSNLYLYRIEVPSSNERIPAKVITQEDSFSDRLIIFGPQNYIETDSPEPMEHEQCAAWCQHRLHL